MKFAGLTTLLASILLLGGCSSVPLHRSDSQASKRLPTISQVPRPVAAANLLRNELVLQSLALLDTNYVYGGGDPKSGFDCSGLVSYVVNNTSGQKLPHNAAQIANMTEVIRPAELGPGDLVFFNTTGAQYSHVGIMVDNNKFIHAPSNGGRVRIDSIDKKYYLTRITGARRLFN